MNRRKKWEKFNISTIYKKCLCVESFQGPHYSIDNPHTTRRQVSRREPTRSPSYSKQQMESNISSYSTQHVVSHTIKQQAALQDFRMRFRFLVESWIHNRIEHETIELVDVAFTVIWRPSFVDRYTKRPFPWQYVRKCCKTKVLKLA